MRWEPPLEFSPQQLSSSHWAEPTRSKGRVSCAPSALHLSASSVRVASRQNALKAGVLIARHLRARAERRLESSASDSSSSVAPMRFEVCDKRHQVRCEICSESRARHAPALAKSSHLRGTCAQQSRGSSRSMLTWLVGGADCIFAFRPKVQQTLNSGTTVGRRFRTDT